jgi:hypothetical protein
VSHEIVFANPIAPIENSANNFNLLIKQSDVLAQSRIIPRAYQNKPYDIVAAGLAGMSFGWDVMTSLRNYHVIEGTASLRPEAMLGLVRRSGHSVNLDLLDDEQGRVAVATGKRRDTGDQHTARFSTAHAKQAGLAGKNNWKQYEDAMLTWRAVSQLCRVLFPDVVLGAGYVPEEIGADVSLDGTPVEVDPLTPVLVQAIDAKRRLLEACNGDKEMARAHWGDLGNEPLTEVMVDVLIRSALSSDIVEAEVVETETDVEAIIERLANQFTADVVEENLQPQPTKKTTKGETK